MLCSSFADMMENYIQQQQQQGDLADIVRASTSSSGLSLSEDHWLFPSDVNDNITTTLNDFQPSITHHHVDQNDDFGDPFITNNFTHPLLINDHLSTSSSTSASFYTNNNNPHHGFLAAAHGGLGFRQPSNNNNIFSRMLQISPNPNMSQPQPPPTGGLLSAPTKSDVMICSKAAAEAAPGMVQISSPRNAGIKRRKSQAKKVVCIPAPTPANSRPSGEVVPSDLWAWRKYGQKPIKGSPYPRGYYRCSSSKGCSARKQVERSRTDPNMLVITYTSEHNHPWPTQRNALAGSTRAQPNKAGSGSKSSSTGSQTQKSASNTNELEDHDKDKPNISLDNPLFDTSLVKEENMDDQQMEMDGCGDVFGSDGFDLHSTYKPALHDNSDHCEDLFADLGEIETDSLSLLFSQGFDQDRDGENKGNMLDHFFDWAGNINSKQP